MACYSENRQWPLQSPDSCRELFADYCKNHSSRYHKRHSLLMLLKMLHISTIVKQRCTFTDFRRRRPLPTPQKQHKSRKNLTNPKRIVSSDSFYNMVCVMETLMNSHFSKTAFSSSSKSIFDDVMLIIIVKMCEKIYYSRQQCLGLCTL